MFFNGVYLQENKYTKYLNKYRQHIGLAMIQGGNALFPLLAFPIIYSSIGAERFSQIVFSESVVMILFSLVIYSFDVTGVRDIKKSVDASSKGKIFFDIFWFRLFISIFLTAALLLLYFTFNLDLYLLLVLWMLLPIGYAFQSNYFYLANNDNQVLGTIVVGVRSISLLFIVFFLDGSSENEVITLCLSSSFLISGLISFLYCVIFKVDRFLFISRKDVLSMMKDGFPILVSNISVGLFRGSNVIILSVLSTSGAVSLYSMAEKFIKATQALMTPLNQLGLARFSEKYGVSDKTLRALLWSCTRNQILISSLFVSIIIISLSVVSFWGHSIYQDLWNICLIYILMSPATIFGILSYMYGMVGMNIIGLKKQFSYCVLSAGFISVMLSSLTVIYFAQYSAAASYLCGEMILFGMVYFVIRRNEKNER
ncbi:PST family polysaccharide transporter [Aeromonas veronii]|uniref:oligosaccharide flippase family protein n=1 Tax=Aeromonas veronii TaxID=654 RepID=UPI00161837AF|nr:oligosaccharide flippase family protein [Aeromonas veronii]MCS3831906.1 PST family polysaccharide transporter [Aeromonas veronii]